MLLAGQLALEPAAAAPPTPQGLKPGSLNSPGPTVSATAVNLEWSPSEGATYYELGLRDLTTGGLVLDHTVTATSYAAELEPGRSYKWDVAACDSGGCTAHAEDRYFRTPGDAAPTPGDAPPTPGDAPPTPADLSPGSTTGPGPTVGSTTVVLEWTASHGASHYDLGIRDQGTGEVVVDRRVAGKSFTAVLDSGRAFKWDLVACNHSGHSPTAPERYFQTPPAAPSISGVSPDPVTASPRRQPFKIFGGDFVETPNVTLRDLTTDEVYPNRTIRSFGGDRIVIEPVFGTVGASWSAETWSVEVVNPDGQSSGPFEFQVIAPGSTAATTVD